MTYDDKFRWEQFHFRKKIDFTDEAIASCYLGKIFLIWQYRNYSESFFLFCHDLDFAKDKIQISRVRGSNWGIQEIPTIVFAGHNDALIVGEYGSPKPLDDFFKTPNDTYSIVNFGRYFYSKTNKNIFRIVCDKKIATPAELPYAIHKSTSFGGDRYLHWEVDSTSKCTT